MINMDQVLDRCRRVQADSVPDAVRARWLLELEGRLYAQVTGRDEPDRLPVTHWPAQADEPLLADRPYEGLYELWVLANVEFELGNYEDYNALTDRFDDLYRAFRAHWRSTHRPHPARVTV